MKREQFSPQLAFEARASRAERDAERRTALVDEFKENGII
jgi:hypothetical protein